MEIITPLFLNIFLCLINSYFTGKIAKRFWPSLNNYFCFSFGTIAFFAYLEIIFIPIIIIPNLINYLFVLVYYLAAQLIAIVAYIINWRYSFNFKKINKTNWLFLLVIIFVVLISLGFHNYQNSDTLSKTINLKDIITNNTNQIDIFSTLNLSVLILFNVNNYSEVLSYIWLLPNAIFIATTIIGIFPIYQLSNKKGIINFVSIILLTSTLSFLFNSDASTCRPWVIASLLIFLYFCKISYQCISHKMFTIMINIWSLGSYFVMPDFAVVIILLNISLLFINMYRQINQLFWWNFWTVLSPLTIISLVYTKQANIIGIVLPIIVLFFYLFIIFFVTIPINKRNKTHVFKTSQIKIIFIFLAIIIACFIVFVLLKVFHNVSVQENIWFLEQILNRSISEKHNYKLFWIVNSIYWASNICLCLLTIFLTSKSIIKRKNNDFSTSLLSLENYLLVCNPISSNLWMQIHMSTNLIINLSLLLNSSIYINLFIQKINKIKELSAILLLSSLSIITSTLILLNLIL